MGTGDAEGTTSTATGSHRDSTASPPPYAASTPNPAVHNHGPSSNAPPPVVFQAAPMYGGSLQPGVYIVTQPGGPLLPASALAFPPNGYGTLPPGNHAFQTGGRGPIVGGFGAQPVVYTPLLGQQGRSSEVALLIAGL